MRDILTPTKGIPSGVNHLRVWDKGDLTGHYAPVFLHVFQTELFMFVFEVILQGHKVWGGRKEVHPVQYFCLKGK